MLCIPFLFLVAVTFVGYSASYYFYYFELARYTEISPKVILEIPLKPRVLITGVGRSGTTGLNQAFAKAGFKSRHEAFGKEISIGWSLALYREYPMKDNFEKNQWHNYLKRHPNVTFDARIHLVRHPLKTISSLTSIHGPSRKYIIHVTPSIAYNMSKLEISMHHWHDWNRRIEKYADKRWQIETVDIQKECLDLWKDDDRCLNVMLRPKLSINHRSHEMYSWHNLERIDAVLTNKIKRMCVKYGYSNCSH